MLIGLRARDTGGFTLPEIVVAATLVAVFFLSIFEVNGLCLRFISASKENVGATEAVHDRLEQLRNADFSTLTTVSSIKSLLAQPANSSPLAKKAIETVTVSNYPSGSPTITYTRAINKPLARLGARTTPASTRPRPKRASSSAIRAPRRDSRVRRRRRPRCTSSSPRSAASPTRRTCR